MKSFGAQDEDEMLDKIYEQERKPSIMMNKKGLTNMPSATGQQTQGDQACCNSKCAIF